MTIQLDAPVLDFAKLEEFAGKVSADQAAAYNAILVYLGDRLGLWRGLAFCQGRPPSPSSPSTPNFRALPAGVAVRPGGERLT